MIILIVNALRYIFFVCIIDNMVLAIIILHKILSVRNHGLLFCIPAMMSGICTNIAPIHISRLRL